MASLTRPDDRIRKVCKQSRATNADDREHDCTRVFAPVERFGIPFSVRFPAAAFAGRGFLAKARTSQRRDQLSLLELRDGAEDLPNESGGQSVINKGVSAAIRATPTSRR
jgi:hypothetical protein